MKRAIVRTLTMAQKTDFNSYFPIVLCLADCVESSAYGVLPGASTFEVSASLKQCLYLPSV